MRGLKIRSASLRSWLSGKRSGIWSRVIIYALAWAVCFLLLSMNLTPAPIRLELGKPAVKAVVAHRTVLNKPATDMLKAEARKNFLLSSAGSPAFLRINESVALVSESKLDSLFGLLVSYRDDGLGSGSESVSGFVAKAKELGLPAPDRASIQYLLSTDRALFDRISGIAKGYVVGILGSRKVQQANLQTERSATSQALAKLGLDAQTASAAAKLVADYIEVNTVVDVSALERGAEEAEAAVQPIFIPKGTVIVKQGQMVNENHIALTESLGIMEGMEPLWASIALSLATAMVLIIHSAFMFWLKSSAMGNVKKFGLAMALVTFSVFMSWASFRFFGILAPLFVPIAYIAMTLTLMIDEQAGISAGIAAAIFNALMFQESLMAFVAPMIGIFIGIRTAKGRVDRFSIVKGAIYIAAATFLAVACLAAISGERIVGGMLAASIVNGLLSAVLCLGTMPFAEAALGLSSPFRLLEVSNPGNELLRQIMMKAPGTYHHSIVVGNLAEAAASRVGADPLLVRAAALYHDCGKVNQPQFFVENQVNKVNPHDSLPPDVSAGIIIDHVNYGVEMAKSNGLPQGIIDIIAQHHGDSKVWYFYHKAMGKSGSVVDESKYCYPGPKPQTAEAALIMLADICEAKVRSMNASDPTAMREAIHSLIRERLYAGDLNETPLTLKDLDFVEESFVGTICGVRHERIAYPGQPSLFKADTQNEEPDEPERSAEGTDDEEDA